MEKTKTNTDARSVTYNLQQSCCFLHTGPLNEHACNCNRGPLSKRLLQGGCIHKAHTLSAICLRIRLELFFFNSTKAEKQQFVRQSVRLSPSLAFILFDSAPTFTSTKNNLLVIFIFLFLFVYTHINVYIYI